jgi:translation initiation factor 2B subunit (eIF-2B alpha/beta/delta family)
MQGQVVSTDQAKLLSEANNYATTKSVTQVIFTTSAIASNVTLWNQVGSTQRPNHSRYSTT